MQITDRDRRLFQGLALFRVLTIKQIQAHFFDNLARSLVQRRLSKLKKGGYLNSFAFGEKGKHAWTIAKKGALRIGENPQLFQRPPNRNTIFHDLIVAETGLRLYSQNLLKEWTATYLLERSAEYRGQHVPDATFKILISGNQTSQMSLEVENSLKTSRKLNEMLSFYRHQTPRRNVLILWRNKRLKEQLKKLLSPFDSHIWIATQSYEPHLGLHFSNNREKEIQLGKADTAGDSTYIKNGMSAMENVAF